MVTRDDFQNILNNEELLNKVAVVAMSEVDPQKTGSLNLEALGMLMQHVAVEAGDKLPSQEDVEQVFAQLDKNGDNLIDLNEFKALIQRVIKYTLESDIIQDI